MTRKSLKKIELPEKIFTEVDLKELNITVSFIYSLFSDNASQNKFLARSGIFKNTMDCNKCHTETELCYIKRNYSPDGFYWVFRKPCRFYTSIRPKIVFEGSRLDMRIIILIM
ncbi:hypothetical protein DMUE_1434 [Dictyocoela muelleri]|nr:hypothetical protein DMUE_1434 [Dictyocoela muelleri]